MMRNRLFLVGLVMACGGDDSSSTPTTTATTMDPVTADGVPATESDPATPTTATTDPATSSSGNPVTTTGADSSDATGDSSGDTGEPPAAVCPGPPYADAPLPQPMVTATALPNTQSGVHPGGLAEGPVWIDGALYLSNFSFGAEPPSSILRYVPGESLQEHIPSSGSNGLAVDARGFIVAATHDDGGISRFGLDGSRTSIAAEYQGNRLNSPNDLTVRSDGTIYFSDPNWQAQNPNPQPVHGVYRIDPAGTVHLEDGGQNLPNGMTLSPDETVLYVGTPGGVLRYDVGADGALATPPMTFAGGLGLNSVDGMGMDCAGNLYVTLHSQGQVRVIAPDGSDLGTIMVASSLTNVAFGGPERRTLFATAGDPNNGNALYSVELEIPGYPF